MKTNDFSYLSATIAAFNFIVGPLGPIEKKNGKDYLGAFVSDVKQGIKIRIVSNGPPQEIPLSARIFSSGSHWELYRLEQNYYYKIIAKEKGRNFISRLAVFPPDFNLGEIHIYSPVGDKDFPLKYPLDQLLLINLASLSKGLLLHACGIILEKKGLLFVGSSGVGKSTIGGLLKKYRDITVLSDDRIVVRKGEDGFMIYGTPWHGTLPFSSPQKAELKKIFFLKKADKNEVTPLSLAESSLRLSANSFLPYWEDKFMSLSLSTIAELTAQDIFFELSFLPDKTTVDFLEDVI